MRALRFVAGMRLAQMLADCGARLVLARVLMTDFIDWKIKSLGYRKASDHSSGLLAE